ADPPCSDGGANTGPDAVGRSASKPAAASRAVNDNANNQRGSCSGADCTGSAAAAEGLGDLASRSTGGEAGAVSTVVWKSLAVQVTLKSVVWADRKRQ